MKARNSSVSRGTYTTVHPHQPSAHHPSCRLRRALTPHGVHRPGRSTGPCGKCLINVREHHSSESYMSQHALNNLITHAAKQRPETRRARARGITAHWPLGCRFYLSDVSGRATPPTRVLGSTVRTDTTRVPRRRSDRVFLSILLSLVCVRSDLFVDLRPMRNGNALTYSGVYRSRTESMRCAPAHMRMREGGGRHRRRSAVFALSFAPAFNGQAEAAKIDHRHRTSWTLECTSSGGRSGARPYDPDPSAFPFTIH